MKNNKVLWILCGLILAGVVFMAMATVKGPDQEPAAGSSAVQEESEEKEVSSENTEETAQNEVSEDDQESESQGEDVVLSREEYLEQQEENNSKDKDGEENPGTVDIGKLEKAEACYEHWLAAAVVTGISLQYFDFEIQGIYYESEQPLEQAEQSLGVTVVFTGDGQELMIQSRPLTQERTEAGTMDLHAADLGFATFDVSAPEANVSEGKQSVSMEDLTELIQQSVLVSLYER